MNITYIVGNGLDLQYGLKTRYRDFYEFQNKVYISRTENEEKYSNFIYESLFSDKVNDYENWSDFELSIGKLTKDNDLISSSIEIKEKFIDDFSEVVDDLREYLRIQQEKNLEKGNAIDFISTLDDMRTSLPVINQPAIDKKYNENPHQDDIVNIVTLNYTHVIDKLYNGSAKSFRNQLRANLYNFYIEPPIHAHGTVDVCTVLGVSDEIQISNSLEEQKESLIKSLVLKNYR
ncbi:TPA: tryptophan synthase subunit beta, partial [Streptococcus pneumoniae]|nr:tryptophan synthase subunit beta [Streptococcus pneumoniae]